MNTLVTAGSKRVAAPLAAPTFSARDVEKNLGLAEGSNGIELAISVPVTGHPAKPASIELDPVERGALAADVLA